jgi:hypothetical protein
MCASKSSMPELLEVEDEVQELISTDQDSEDDENSVDDYDAEDDDDCVNDDDAKNDDDFVDDYDSENDNNSVNAVSVDDCKSSGCKYDCQRL